MGLFIVSTLQTGGEWDYLLFQPYILGGEWGYFLFHPYILGGECFFCCFNHKTLVANGAIC
jgi:hypothetical protein